MKAESLRSLQAPLKERYRESPADALLTLRAEGRLGSDAVVCRVETGRALVEAGLHPATGGDGLAVCSGDMPPPSLAACAAAPLQAAATSFDAVNLDVLVVQERMEQAHRIRPAADTGDQSVG